MAVEILNTLVPAYGPCPAFAGPCKDMRYEPAVGLYPRGYAGATGSLEDIDLVLCIAEPGEPAPNSKSQPTLAPAELPRRIADSVGNAFASRPSVFHGNVRLVLELCWPGRSFEERMKRTWITEGVLCSASSSAAPVPAIVERECATRYLRAQLAVLPGRFVIALGLKAQRRLKLAGRPADVVAFAAGLPGCNQRGARPSWAHAATAFREYLRAKGSPRGPGVTK